MREVVEVLGGPLQRIIRIRGLAHAASGDAATLRNDLEATFATLLEELRALGFAEHDVGDILFALVAFADEAALAASDAMRSTWLSALLQRHYFGENNAGESFFRRLATIRQDPQRKHVLAAYYLCLVLGFQGQYRLVSGTQVGAPSLEALLKQLSRELPVDVDRDAPLAPRGLRPVGESWGGKDSWRWRLRWPLAALSGALLWFLVLQVGLHFHRVSVSDALQLGASAPQPSGSHLLGPRRAQAAELP